MKKMHKWGGGIIKKLLVHLIKLFEKDCQMTGAITVNKIQLCKNCLKFSLHFRLLKEKGRQLLVLINPLSARTFHK
jgi:hypothetical protein